MRADRLVAIVLLLQARGGMSAPDLARELEVSVRTIYRDVDALGSAGVPVYTEQGVGGGIRLLDGYRMDLTGLSPGEAEALFLMGIPGPLDELGLGSATDAATRKLLASLPPAGRASAERVRQRIHVDASGWERDRDRQPLPWLPVIARAVWSDHRLAMTYVRGDDNQEVERTVDPLGLVLKAGQWYLAAKSGQWDVTYRVSRVRRAEVLDAPASRPAAFDLASHWAESLEEFQTERGALAVHVLVAPAAVDELPLVLGETVRARLPAGARDASQWVPLELTFDSVADARRQLLGLGGSVRVVAPDALADALADAAAAVVAVYRPSDPPS